MDFLAAEMPGALPSQTLPFQGLNFIVELPPRRDCETVVEKKWKVGIAEGLEFEGQRYVFPEGLDVKTGTRWLEESLLSVQLSLSALLTGECARCLADASLEISDDLMYLYYLRGMELGKDTELQSDEGFMPVEVDFWGRTLNLSDQVWESLLTLLPFKMLCREDCAGLCPSCGADLNVGPCACVPQSGDPRFEVLSGIFVDENGYEKYGMKEGKNNGGTKKKTIPRTHG